MLQPIEPVGPPLPTRAILSQSWRWVSFLHWRVPSATVAPLLPAGTRPDEFDGSSWVGLIAFHLSEFAIRPGPPLPYVGRFPEVNVRLYSVDGEGRRGVVFRSLEASRLPTVLGARAAMNVPYQWARMSMRVGRSSIEYRSTRRTGTHPSTRLVTRPGTEGGTPAVVDDPLADFLTARWGMHTRILGRTRFVPNTHERWPLVQGELVSLDDELLAAAGIPGLPLQRPDSVLYSPGVHTEFGLPV